MLAKPGNLLQLFHLFIRCLSPKMFTEDSENIPRSYKNDEVIRRAQSRRLPDIVTERRVKFAGHILRMSEDRLAKVAMKWQPLLGKRKRGRLKIPWRRTFKKDLSNVNKAWENIDLEATDRDVWRKIGAFCTDMCRRT